MAWETRRGRRYYYRATKVGGRVVKEYVGACLLAELAAARDDEARAERATAAEVRRSERDRLTAVDATVAAADRTIESLLRALLVASGYHRHHRGEWRRRRDG